MMIALKARGLCTNSYMDGLNFIEFIYHLGTSRDSVIETKIKTSESGYAQRKLIKNMESIKVNYDGTVRAYGQIFQMVYGGNGCDTTKQFSYNIKMINMNNDDLKKYVMFDESELKQYKNWSQKQNTAIYNTIKLMRDGIRRSLVSATLATRSNTNITYDVSC